MSRCDICGDEFYRVSYDPPDPGEPCRCGHDYNWGKPNLLPFRAMREDYLVDGLKYWWNQLRTEGYTWRLWAKWRLIHASIWLSWYPFGWLAYVIETGERP